MTSVPPFPGAIGLSGLDVYDWEDDAGVHGGAPHVHLVCSEAYVVVRGRGRVQLLSADGYREVPLEARDVVWYEPGTIHRSVNDGDLAVVAVMGNSGLPEAGDAVMTFSDEDLASPESYAAAASLGPTPTAKAALARRDRALAGFRVLREAAEAGDLGPLERFFARAAAIVRPRLDEWRGAITDGPLASAHASLQQVDALAAGDVAHLRDARTTRIPGPEGRTFGMCGLLRAYDPIRRAASATEAR